MHVHQMAMPALHQHVLPAAIPVVHALLPRSLVRQSPPRLIGVPHALNVSQSIILSEFELKKSQNEQEARPNSGLHYSAVRRKRLSLLLDALYVVVALWVACEMIFRQSDFIAEVRVARRVIENVFANVRADPIEQVLQLPLEPCPAHTREARLFAWAGTQQGCVCRQHEVRFHDYEYCMIEADERDCEDIDAL